MRERPDGPGGVDLASSRVRDAANDRRASLAVALFPPAKPDQPASFLALLRQGLMRAGAVVLDHRPVRIGWSMRQREVDVVHLHWLEYAAASDSRPFVGWALSWFRVARLITFLLVLRARRIGVVWTIHNLSPHQPIRPRAERTCARAVYALATEVIVHSDYSARRASETFRTRRARPLRVIPHANYIGAFPEPAASREQLRAALEIPANGFVYLAFGLIRGYKRLPLLVEQFGQLDGEDLRLIIAGPPSQPEELASVQRAAARDARVIVRAEYIPDAEVAELHLAADAAVLAYSDLFSSGALLLALSFGLPAIAPAAGTSGELFSSPAVELFHSDDLRDAMIRVRSGGRASAARASAESFPWSQAAAQTLAAYGSACRRR
jgi:glycosyltransferase involved in cell wall biosynthesis